MKYVLRKYYAGHSGTDLIADNHTCQYLLQKKAPILPEFPMTEIQHRRSCDSGTCWWCLILHSRLLDPLTLHHCIRLSINVTCKLWFVALFCLSWKRDPSSVALSEVSFFLFFTLLKRSFHQHGKFFLTRVECLRTENVVHCTDCKAHWGNVIAIFIYINKTDLIWSWFDLQLNADVESGGALDLEFCVCVYDS